MLDHGYHSLTAPLSPGNCLLQVAARFHTMFVLCATMQWWRLLAAEGRARRVAEAALRSKAEAEAKVSLCRGVQGEGEGFAAKGEGGGLLRLRCAARQRRRPG